MEHPGLGSFMTKEKASSTLLKVLKCHTIVYSCKQVFFYNHCGLKTCEILICPLCGFFYKPHLYWISYQFQFEVEEGFLTQKVIHQ